MLSKYFHDLIKSRFKTAFQLLVTTLNECFTLFRGEEGGGTKLNVTATNYPPA